MTIVLVSGDLREPALSLEERRDDLIRQLDAAHSTGSRNYAGCLMG